MRKLSGKIIAITGGSSGIGKHISETFSSGNVVVDLSRSAETSSIFDGGENRKPDSII